MNVSVSLFVATYSQSAIAFCHPEVDEPDGKIFCWIPKEAIQNFDDLPDFTDTEERIEIEITESLAIEKDLDSYCEELEHEAR